MGLQQDAIQRRHDAIIDLAKEEPRTTKELNAILGGSYHTINGDIKLLVAQGKLKQCGLRSGSVLFTSNADIRTGYPMVWYNQGCSKGANVKDEANIVRRQHYVTEAVKSAFILEQMSVKVLEYANDTRTGEFDAKGVASKREEVRAAIRHIETLLIKARSLEGNDDCWGKTGLQRIAAIDNFPPQEVFKTVEQVELPLANEAFNNMVKEIERGRINAAKQSTANEAGSAAIVAGATDIRGTDNVSLSSNGENELQQDVPRDVSEHTVPVTNITNLL